MGYVDRHGGYHEDAKSFARANAQYDQAEALTKLAKQAEESRRETRNAGQKERSFQAAQQLAQQAALLERISEQERVAKQERVDVLMQTPEGRAKLKKEEKRKVLIGTLFLFALFSLATIIKLIEQSWWALFYGLIACGGFLLLKRELVNSFKAWNGIHEGEELGGSVHRPRRDKKKKKKP
jgi:hypothetical protein